MRHLLRSICTRDGDTLAFHHAAACGAEAKFLCTDVRLVDCPKCKERMDADNPRISKEN